MSTRISSSLLVLSLALAAQAATHPPDESGAHTSGVQPHAATNSVRLWTNTRTGEKVRGSLLAARSKTAYIECEDGKVVAIPLIELTFADRVMAEEHIARVKALNEQLFASALQPGDADKAIAGAIQPAQKEKPQQAAPFDLFAPFVKTRWDDRWLYVESDGLPHAPAAHPVMVGIKSWQQQVPFPQAYTGTNAWQIPLHPELADKPISGKTQLYRGAIALAANGVPIFNALNNRGDDTFKVGELDDYGGHSGRADDYHYHIAPLSLQKVVGADKPIAYALDGFPLFGLYDAAAKKGDAKACPLGATDGLDELNGHFGVNTDGSKGLYHYHASTAYPYINGGVRGKVTVKEDQIDPQPRATPVRQWLQPLRGAAITGFKTIAEKSWSLEYTLEGKKHLVNFRIEEGGKRVFEFVDPDGTKKVETYTARPERDRPPAPDGNPDQRNRRKGREGQGDRPPPPPPGGTPRQDQPPPAPKASATGFQLLSPAVAADGKLPAEFTCDGASISPPLAWAKAPAGTRSFAVTMHHIPGPPRPGDKPGEDKHVYLVLYGIPAETLALDKGQTRLGHFGINTVNRRASYAPPCSKGPGAKTYTITVYALASDPTLKATGAAGPTMDELLAAIKDSTLATATLDVTYERPNR